MTLTRLLSLAFCSGLAAGSLAGDGGLPSKWFLNAHNSYPEKDRGTDRLERARRAGLWAVELDLVWSEERARTVVSHDKKLHGAEPTLEAYFFAPLAAELRQMPPGQPGLLLMLDLKTDHPGPVQELRQLLEQRRDLVTKAKRNGELEWAPLTVILSENAAAIAMFESLTPPGEPYLAMGVREPPERKFQADVASYFPRPATPFYRLFNFDWKHVENAKNPEAGALTTAERTRLRHIVRLARENGYWTRAWTLNATSQEWGVGNNFGSRRTLLERWRAARDAAVDCVATDEYRLAGEFMRTAGAKPPTARSRD